MLKSIDGPTEAAIVTDGEFKDCLAVKYILFAAFRLSLGEAWLQTDCGGRVTAVLLNKNDGTIICPSSSADLRELSEFASFSVKIYILLRERLRGRKSRFYGALRITAKRNLRTAALRHNRRRIQGADR